MVDTSDALLVVEVPGSDVAVLRTSGAKAVRDHLNPQLAPAFGAEPGRLQAKSFPALVVELVLLRCAGVLAAAQGTEAVAQLFPFTGIPRSESIARSCSGARPNVVR